MGLKGLISGIAKRVHLRTDLRDGSIKNRLFYGEMEVFRVEEEGNPLRRYVVPLIGKNDMEILSSREYAKIQEFVLRSPERASQCLEEIRSETKEAAETIQKILRKMAHSEDEILRTFAFREL